MKRIFAVFAVLALMAGMAMAAPSIYGSNGLIRIISAENAGSYGIGFHGVAVLKDSSATWLLKYKNVTVYPEAYYALNDKFELSLASVYNYYRPDPWSSAAGYANGLLDTRFGVKYSHKMSDLFCLGVYAGYDIPTMGMMDSLLEVKDPNKHMGTVHGMLIPGFNFGAAKLDVNVGIAYDLDKVADVATVDTTDNKSVYPNMSIPFGLGFSYKASDMFTPFLEVTGQYDMDTMKYGTPVADAKTKGPLNYNFFITPGVRVSFPFGLNFDAAFSYNLIDTAKAIAGKGSFMNPDWQIVTGLSYAPVKATGPKVAPTASISGKVTDAKGKGLAATVTAGGLTANTDPATGAYTLAGLPITKVPTEIKAVAKLYNYKSGSVILTKKNKKTPAEQNFALELTPIPTGVAKGVVKDAVTGAPVEASVAFAGPKAETAKVVAGAYSATLQVGNYTATVAAVGYFDKVAIIAIADKGTATSEFMMLKKGMVLPVEVTWTAANKAMIKAVNVEALVKMLQDSPKAKVVITAIVDRVGGKKMNQKLATSRADAIQAELVKANIDAARITTVGQLAAPAGKTNAQRAANTKVEVSFVE